MPLRANFSAVIQRESGNPQIPLLEYLQVMTS